MPWLSLVCQRLIAEASLAIGTYRQRSVGERVLAVAVGAVQQQNQGVKDAPEMLLSSLGQSEELWSSLRAFFQYAPPGRVALDRFIIVRTLKKTERRSCIQTGKRLGT